MIDLIKRYVITERSVTRMEHDQYTFDVNSQLTKPQIKILFEDYFNVTVVRVNTHRPPAKKTRIGQYTGKKASYKRAIITVKKGDVVFRQS